LKIKVSVTVTHATIIFEDNGIGINQDLQEKVFNMFFRATEKSEGAGLGLYIVKEAIDKLGGTIEMKSTFGQGTQFTMRVINHKSL